MMAMHYWRPRDGCLKVTVDGRLAVRMDGHDCPHRRLLGLKARIVGTVCGY